MALRITEILKSKGLRMSDLASRLGTNQSNLMKSLNGNPTLEKLQEIAKALNVEVYELMTDALSSAPSGTIQIGGKTYGIVEVPGIVKLPHYTDYGVLRKAISTFIEGAMEGNKPTSMMGQVEVMEVFSLAFVPLDKTFVLSLCCGCGEQVTIIYDMLEFADAGGKIDRAQLIQEVINDVEGAVAAKQ